MPAAARAKWTSWRRIRSSALLQAAPPATLGSAVQTCAVHRLWPAARRRMERFCGASPLISLRSVRSSRKLAVSLAGFVRSLCRDQPVASRVRSGISILLSSDALLLSWKLASVVGSHSLARHLSAHSPLSVCLRAPALHGYCLDAVDENCNTVMGLCCIGLSQRCFLPIEQHLHRPATCIRRLSEAAVGHIRNERDGIARHPTARPQWPVLAAVGPVRRHGASAPRAPHRRARHFATYQHRLGLCGELHARRDIVLLADALF